MKEDKFLDKDERTIIDGKLDDEDLEQVSGGLEHFSDNLFTGWIPTEPIIPYDPDDKH